MISDGSIVKNTFPGRTIAFYDDYRENTVHPGRFASVPAYRRERVPVRRPQVIAGPPDEARLTRLFPA